MSDLFLTETNDNPQDSAFGSSRIVVKTKESNQATDFLNIDAKAKELAGQVEWVITQRKVQYLDDLLRLQKHKSISIRRKIATAMGLLGSFEIIKELSNWQLFESDRQTWLILDDSIDKLKRKNSNSNLEYSVRILTVTEALQQIKSTVSQKEFVIEGELTDIKAIGAMYYFGLKDSEQTRIDCQIYSGKVASFGFPLNDGWAVRASGKFKIDKFGKLRFEVTNMELTGEGQLLRNLQLLEQKLESEGFFDESRKRPIDKIPTNVLLIASPNSAALGDFQKVLKERRQNITIYYLPIKTQGVGAEYEILSKLELANHFCPLLSIQTIVLTRGGGSKDDLMIFNSEKIVRAIHGLVRPSIVAIGHERDECLAEKVADKRASTPSNAAELISLSNLEIQSEINGIHNFCQSYWTQRKTEYQQFSDAVLTTCYQLTNNEIQKQRLICHQIDSFITRIIGSIKASCQSIFENIKFQIRIAIQDQNQIINSLNQHSQLISNQVNNLQYEIQSLWRICFNNQQFEVNNQLQQLQLQFNTLRLFEPNNILKMGYTIVLQNNQIIQKSTDYQANQPTQIQFHDKVIEVE